MVKTGLPVILFSLFLRLACPQTVIPQTDRRLRWFLTAGTPSSYKPFTCTCSDSFSTSSNCPRCVALHFEGFLKCALFLFSLAYLDVGKHKHNHFAIWTFS